MERDLIKRFEGLRLEAYRCPAGVLTIGYGHTRDVRIDQRITEEQADALLSQDIAMCNIDIDRLVKVQLNRNQRAALIDWVFNLGAANLKQSTLLKRINEGASDDIICDEIRKWVYSGGAVLPGLVTRRKAEMELWKQ